MPQYLVSPLIHIDSIRGDGRAIALNIQEMRLRLSAPHDIYVFDTLDQARDYVFIKKKVEAPEAQTVVLLRDYPIFEITLPNDAQITVRKTALQIPAQHGPSEKSTSLTLKECTGLTVSQLEHGLRGVHSAYGYGYTFQSEQPRPDHQRGCTIC